MIRRIGKFESAGDGIGAEVAVDARAGAGIGSDALMLAM